MKTEIQPKKIETISPSMNDWEGVKNLRLEALQNDPYAFGSSYESEAQRTDEEWKKRLEDTQGENPKEFLVIAKDDTKYTGMIGAFPKSEKLWNIKAVYVTPEYRGKGVSRALVEEILKKIDAKGADTVQLSVNATSEAAVKLYESFGFEIFEKAEGYEFGDGKKYDKYEMRRIKKQQM